MQSLRWIFLLGLIILWIGITVSPSAACDPDDMLRTGCSPWMPMLASITATAIANLPPTPTATPLPTPRIIVMPTPSGNTPSAARDVPDEWQSLAPRASIWYKTNYSDNFRLLEYWLEMNLPDVAEFAVYSPVQADGLSPATKPVGRGTHSKSDLENVIRWKAGYADPGIWYVYLSNRTDQPISYKLNHNQEIVPTKSCVSYWEPLGGSMILWTDCGRYTGQH